MGCISIGRIFPGEKKFLGVNFPGEILHWGDLTELLYEIPFKRLAFSLPIFLYVEMIWWIYPSLFLARFDFWELISRERGISRVIKKPVRD